MATRRPTTKRTVRTQPSAEEPKPQEQQGRTYEPADVGRRTVFASGAGAGIGNAGGMFRRGQWVIVKGALPDDKKRRVGIYVAAKSMLTGEVHLCNPDGTTMLSLPEHPHANLEAATFDDIPEARRPRQPSMRYPRRADSRADG